MSPHLRYAQAIHGRVSGPRRRDHRHAAPRRGGARDRGARRARRALTPRSASACASWFGDYVEWMTTHEYGIAERDTKNNHATCWAAAGRGLRARSRVARISSRFCRERFKTVLLPDQMAPDGSFPQETRRTKPYAYSLFNLEAMAAHRAARLRRLPTTCGASRSPDGRGLERGMAFMVPFMRDRKGWPYPKDVMYDSEWPMRQASLLFAGLALRRARLPRAVVGRCRPTRTSRK